MSEMPIIYACIFKWYTYAEYISRVERKTGVSQMVVFPQT